VTSGLRTFDELRGYVATAAELRQPVMALSLGRLRRKIEIALLPDDVDVRLVLDRAARLERDRRRSLRWRLRWRVCRYQAALDRIGTRRSKSATAGGVRRASASQRITRNESERRRSAARPSFARPARRIDGSMDSSPLSPGRFHA
jgi:hypothetical protein